MNIREKRQTMKVGDRARFFDANSDWKTTGDIGDNDIYFLPATIVRVWSHNSIELVDIVWDHHPGIVSKGHFTDLTREADKMNTNAKIIAATACPNCKAKRGDPCTTITKQPMTLVHVARGDRYRHKLETAKYLRDRMRTQT